MEENGTLLCIERREFSVTESWVKIVLFNLFYRSKNVSVLMGLDRFVDAKTVLLSYSSSIIYGFMVSCRLNFVQVFLIYPTLFTI